MCGDFVPEHDLERQLAEFSGSEAALLFPSGYAANCGILPAFAGPEDLILSDALNHASIIDGCRLSRARVEVYPHAEVGAVEEALRAQATEYCSTTASASKLRFALPARAECGRPSDRRRNQR